MLGLGFLLRPLRGSPSPSPPAIPGRSAPLPGPAEEAGPGRRRLLSVSIPEPLPGRSAAAAGAGGSRCKETKLRPRRPSAEPPSLFRRSPSRPQPRGCAKMAEYCVKPKLYKGKLHEYCQKTKLQLEYKDVKVEGPPHDRVFTVMVVIDNREYPVATGKTKKEAKEEAAKTAWDSITQENQPQPSPPPPPQPTAFSSDILEKMQPLDYISMLTKYGLKHNIMIEYKLEDESGPPHKKTFSFSCKIGDQIYGKGTGNDKKAAKQAAAKHAYEQLHLQETSRIQAGRHSAVASSANSLLSFSSGMSSWSSANGSDSASKNINSDGSLVNKMNDLKVDEDCSSPWATPKNAAMKSKRREILTKLAPLFSSQQIKEEKKENKYTKDERLIKDFEELEPIGIGGFGNVFKAKQIIDKRYYAVKRVTCSDKVQREVQALAELAHENIIRYYTSWTGKDFLNSDNSSSLSRSRPDLLCDCLFIQMEFCEKGTLDGWIDEKRGKENYQNESLIKFRQIVKGVEYIHSKGFIHRDLKPLNIFISHENKIKIGDFGLVTSMTDDLRTTEKGTRSYMSPEQGGDKYGQEVDIFALGLILFEILWIFSTGTEKVKEWPKIRECVLPEEFSKKFPAEKHIIEQLLLKDIAKRPSASGVLELLKLVDKKNPDTKNVHTC
ncbi:interferon-induced, double-stranded RNA-activated protein kinase isoform X3 [Dermochelys coriacea]|uniref:interferon-induced, double-stranded RNA-activated protein kinase isoform X3 n=1 Tax=Dermochelys coriacea TaxID=27794 RepID=UPI001CA9CFEF|nr:interferon-induced, double-stranded RNA-activated protein kinase isoform X3 [Dermochelys coriacea]